MPSVNSSETFAPRIASALVGLPKHHCVRALTLSALATNVFAAASVNIEGGALDTITITGTGTLTVDGVLTALNDVIGVFGEATGSHNGVYVVATAGAIGVSAVLRRAENMSSSADMKGGCLVLTGSEGQANGGKAYLLNTIALPVMNTTALTLVEVGGSGGTGTQNGAVRAVITTLDAYDGTGTGTLTEHTAASGLGVQDGVTLLAGDLVLLQAGINHISAASDAGPYIISTMGDASHQWKLTRPEWWGTGASIQGGSAISVTEGTLYIGRWTSDAVKGKVVDTDDPAIYPDKVVQAQALTNGAATISNVPIRSATKSIVLVDDVALSGTYTTTVRYGAIAAPTPGALNTASMVINAIAAGQTVVSTDQSTVRVIVLNQ